MEELERHLARLEQEAGEEYLPIVGPAVDEFLASLVKERQPLLVLEIGVMTGYATLHLARHLPAGGRIIGLEISAHLADRARQNVRAAAFEDRVDIRRGDARELLEEVPAPLDFVLLDAEKTMALNYLRRLRGKLADGAVVVTVVPPGQERFLSPYLAAVRADDQFQTRRQVFGETVVEVSEYKPVAGG